MQSLSSVKTSHIFLAGFFAFCVAIWSMWFTTAACNRVGGTPSGKNFFCTIALGINGKSEQRPWKRDRLYFERGVALVTLGRIEEAKRDFSEAAGSPAGARLAGIDERLAEGKDIPPLVIELWFEANKAAIRKRGGPAYETARTQD